MTEKTFTAFIAPPHKRIITLMALLFSIVFVFGLICAPAAAGDRDEMTMTRADQLFAEGTMDSLKQSAELYRQIAQKQPADFEALWKGSRACRRIIRLAVVSEMDDLRQISAKYGGLGMDMAQKAIALEPDRVEGHYYYAVNVGGYAKGVSIWTILREGLKDKASTHLKKAYEIDREYNDFVLEMHMGLYYEVLPWFAGQDKDKALAHYREALRLMPKDALYRPQLQILAGRLMLDQGVEQELARQLLRETAETGSLYFSNMATEILAKNG